MNIKRKYFKSLMIDYFFLCSMGFSFVILFTFNPVEQLDLLFVILLIFAPIIYFIVKDALNNSRQSYGKRQMKIILISKQSETMISAMKSVVINLTTLVVLPLEIMFLMFDTSIVLRLAGVKIIEKE